MFKHIMMPIDMAHADKLDHAMTVAADLAGHYGARLSLVSVTSNLPGSVAHTPEEFAEKLADFAKAKGAALGVETSSRVVVCNDPAVDLDNALIRATEDGQADLVVMATHIPNMSDMILPAHGGELARHSKISVFLVRHG